MKKSLFIIALFAIGNIFSYEQKLVNKTAYQVRAFVRLALCKDEEHVLTAYETKSVPTGACCLKTVQFKGESGPINGVESSELSGSTTGFGISCKGNTFNALNTGSYLFIERD